MASLTNNILTLTPDERDELYGTDWRVNGGKLWEFWKRIGRSVSFDFTKNDYWMYPRGGGCWKLVKTSGKMLRTPEEWMREMGGMVA